MVKENGQANIRLGIVQPRRDFVQFWVGMSEYLNASIDVSFFSLQDKARDMLFQMGQVCYPPKVKTEKGAPLSLEDCLTALPEEMIEPGAEQEVRAEFNSIYLSLKKYIEKEGITALLLWNGYKLLDRAALLLAEEKGLDVIYGENGYFPNTLQIARQGVNFGSTIRKEIEHGWRDITMDEGKYKRLADRMEDFRLGKVQYKAPASKVKASLKLTVSSELKKLFSPRPKRKKQKYNTEIAFWNGDLPERFVFLPFQVSRDSQVKYFSPLVGNDMGKLLELTVNAVAKVDASLPVVVKLHPQDLTHICYDQLAKKYPEVIWIKDKDVKEILAKASLVITVNSTVGIEALIFKKPVITLGESIYNCAAGVWHINELSRFESAIAQALSASVDKKEIDRFLYYLYYECLAHGTYKNHDLTSYKGVADRINKVLK